MHRASVLFTVLLAAAVVTARADEFDEASNPQNFGLDPKNPNKVSDLGAKRFDIPMLDQFGGTAAGFDKQYQTGSSDWIDKKADLGGREIYAPAVDMMKMYDTKDNQMFSSVSPLSGQTSPLTGQKSNLTGDAKVDHFDNIFDDKEYRGREADLIRQAMDRLDQQAQTLLHQQMAGGKAPGPDGGAGLPKTTGPIQVPPLITVEDVRALVNKDLGVASQPDVAQPGTGAAPTAPQIAPAGTSTAAPSSMAKP